MTTTPFDPSPLNAHCLLESRSPYLYLLSGTLSGHIFIKSTYRSCFFLLEILRLPTVYLLKKMYANCGRVQLTADHEVFANFRPVSNVKYVSKRIEKAVAVQLNDYLVCNGLHVPLQCAYIGVIIV